MKVGGFIVRLLALYCKISNKKRKKKHPPYGEYDMKLDVPYIEDGTFDHRYDVFYAKENRKNCLIIDIHGGAYMFSTRKDNYHFATIFLKEGFDVICLDYAPNNGKKDTKDLLDDIVFALNHIFAHLEEFGFAKESIVLTGDSAGGHFALLLAEAIEDKDVAKQLGYEFPDVPLKAVMINCPVYDFGNVTKNMKAGANRRMFGPRWRINEPFVLISPRTYLEKLRMPLFLSTCTNDFLRSQSLLLAEDMKGKTTPFTFLDVESDKPEIGHVHNVIEPELEESTKVNKAMINFVLEALEK